MTTEPDTVEIVWPSPDHRPTEFVLYNATPAPRWWQFWRKGWFRRTVRRQSPLIAWGKFDNGDEA